MDGNFFVVILSPLFIVETNQIEAAVGMDGGN